jgi:cysteine-rich repeat protein
MKVTRTVFIVLGVLALALTACEAEKRDFNGTDGDAGGEAADDEADDGEGSDDGESSDDGADDGQDDGDDGDDEADAGEDSDDGSDDRDNPDAGGEDPGDDEADDDSDDRDDSDAGREDEGDAGGTRVAICEEDEDCDDGNVCNGAEICEDGECLSGRNADDGELCEIDGVDDLLLCIDGNCTQTSCGDGIVDDRTDEQCDDGNDQDGDGCEVGCMYSCNEDSDCADGNMCNGEELCDTDAHVCGSSEAPEDGTECDEDRACFNGRCVGLGCGNGVLEDGEDCDDGNADDGDGCDSDCTFSCVEDSDCDDGSVCSGEETCDTDTNTCVAGEVLACEDGNACTENLCDPELGCSFPLIDADGDGKASTELGSCGQDCDDEDPEVYEGAAELCDEKDNDCDEEVDEEAPVWYVDCDGDGFALSSAASMQQCDMPEAVPTGCTEGAAATWTSTAPEEGQADCYDVASFVRPRLTSDENNSAWSATEYAGRPSGQRYDHNCDEEEEPEITTSGLTASSYCDENPPVIGPGIGIGLLGSRLIIVPIDPVNCWGSNGWVGDTVPDCGDEAAYSTCSGWTGACQRTEGTREQRCR